MSSEASKRQGGLSWLRMAVTVAIAVTSFFTIPLLIESYSSSLREVSAMLAESFLSATHLEVTRKGTILSLEGMVFDIVPACSGSEMIRTLIFTGILWAGIHPRIRFLNKIIAVVLSIILAVFTNGIRLTAILWASYHKGEIIADGLLHTIIGLLAFSLAIASFFIITESLADKKSGPQSPQQRASITNSLLPITLALVVLTYLPVLSACLEAWKGTVYNQYDKHGYIFFFIGLAGWAWLWQRTAADTRRMKAGAILFAVSSLLAVLSQLPGPNYYVLGVTLMISLFAIGLAYRNLVLAIHGLAFQFIIFLSFPKVSEMINFILSTNGNLVPMVGKVILSLLAILVFLKFYLPLTKNTKRYELSSKWSSSMLGTAAITLLTMLYVVRVDNSDSSEPGVLLPYLLGDEITWEGTDIVDKETFDFYQRGNIITRSYHQGEKHVGVMIVPSNGNRKTIHTPEYCQIGLGWEPTRSESIEFIDRNGQRAKARKLLLVHQEKGVQRTFIYWFGDKEGRAIDNYPEFLITDTWRKLFGKQTNWNLYVVWSDQSNESIYEFLPCLHLE